MSLQLGTIIADVNSFLERKTKQDFKKQGHQDGRVKISV